MNQLDKQKYLHWAEVIDSWRIFPRLIMITYLNFAGWIVSYLVVWYCHLPATGRGTQESGMVGGVIAAITGFFPSVLKIYQDGGRNWNVTPPASTTTTAITQTETKQGTP